MQFTIYLPKRCALIPFLGIAIALFVSGCGGGTVGKSNTFSRKVNSAATVGTDWVKPTILVLPFENEEKSGGNQLRTIRAYEKFHFPVQLTRFLRENGCCAEAYYSPLRADSVDYFITGSIIRSDGQNVKVKVRVQDNLGQTLWEGHVSVQMGYNDFSRHYDPSSMIWVEALNNINRNLNNSWLSRRSVIEAKKQENYGSGRPGSPRQMAMLQELIKVERQQVIKPVSELSQHVDSVVGDTYVKWQKEVTRFSQLAAAERADRMNSLAMSYATEFVAAASQATGSRNIGFEEAAKLASADADRSGSNIRALDSSIDKLNEAVAMHLEPITVVVGSKVVRLAGSLSEQLDGLKHIYAQESQAPK